MSANTNDMAGVTASFTSGGLAIGSTTSQFSTAAAITYAINGRLYSKGITATQALTIEDNTSPNPLTPDTFVSLAANQACTFLITLDTAGTFRVVQGPIVDSSATLIPVGVLPDARAVCGVIKVVTNASGTFVPGTTAFNNANVTTTYINMAAHPGGAI